MLPRRALPEAGALRPALAVAARLIATHNLIASQMPSIPPVGGPLEAPRDRTDGEAITPAPLWVKIFGGVLVVLVLAFIATHLAGGGFRPHGP